MSARLLGGHRYREQVGVGFDEVQRHEWQDHVFALADAYQMAE
ncbi:MAG: hypothetical protein OEM94_02620 [Acidimicrobiia bacterium]|nr:hypothetical protein [Acidimicrobiia bacterium]